MRRLLLIIAIFCHMACAEKISVSDLNHINGYWEIVKVEFPNGEIKDYDINTTIDYFEYENMKGFRKKVQPALDGSYATSSDAESFRINERDDLFWMSYQNDLSSWEEQIEVISESILVVKNKEDISYHYKRFEPISIEK